MDTTEQYIKQCEKAEEIQGIGWVTPVDMNWYAGPKSHHIYRGGYDTIETNYIWLPRQDQLQEMVDWVSFTVSRRNDQWRMNANHEIYLADSMEQLWLAFCMWELHKKVWNGEDWHGEQT